MLQNLNPNRNTNTTIIASSPSVHLYPPNQHASPPSLSIVTNTSSPSSRSTSVVTVPASSSSSDLPSPPDSPVSTTSSSSLPYLSTSQQQTRQRTASDSRSQKSSLSGSLPTLYEDFERRRRLTCHLRSKTRRRTAIMPPRRGFAHWRVQG